MRCSYKDGKVYVNKSVNYFVQTESYPIGDCLDMFSNLVSAGHITLQSGFPPVGPT